MSEEYAENWGTSDSGENEVSLEHSTSKVNEPKTDIAKDDAEKLGTSDSGENEVSLEHRTSKVNAPKTVIAKEDAEKWGTSDPGENEVSLEHSTSKVNEPKTVNAKDDAEKLGTSDSGENEVSLEHRTSKVNAPKTVIAKDDAEKLGTSDPGENEVSLEHSTSKVNEPKTDVDKDETEKSKSALTDDSQNREQLENNPENTPMNLLSNNISDKITENGNALIQDRCETNTDDCATGHRKESDSADSVYSSMVNHNTRLDTVYSLANSHTKNCTTDNALDGLNERHQRKNVDSAQPQAQATLENARREMFNRFATSFKNKLVKGDLFSYTSRTKSSQVGLRMRKRPKHDLQASKTSSLKTKQYNCNVKPRDTTNNVCTSSGITFRNTICRCSIHSLPMVMFCMTCNLERCPQCILIYGTCRGHTLEESETVATRRKQVSVLYS